MSELQHLGEAALVVAIGQRQEYALAEAYRRHADQVFGLALQVLRSRQDAQDIVQEVFLRLWLKPERFDPARGTLRAFLLMQSHSRAVDAIRSERARAQWEDRAGRAAAGDSYDLEREIAQSAGGDQILAAVRALSFDERRAIGLAYYGGYSYREVAALLEEPEGTIKSRIRLGLQRLKTVLGEMTETDQ